ncbi:hypothetical protein P280DRAFT_533340 [Massarina eburnea CBS 473.64]|uniref:C2H2-type domain-containing protein n=1 Tax=Massarina eburnea CBS 473.64 TaxID=1395130 RepID=A0A6A6RR25_9PLEO|nr:hypothetical protein P280DRAFT_533340 [Massarina eburnea CBS 473.64]
MFARYRRVLRSLTCKAHELPQQAGVRVGHVSVESASRHTSHCRDCFDVCTRQPLQPYKQTLDAPVLTSSTRPPDMASPPKRLRILQSVEVDETNPDYIAAQEKQKSKLKTKFESIFAKYEAMPESMSDEIDMRTGTIVVDRGHMRRLDRDYRQNRGGRRPGQLLDDVIGGKGRKEKEEGEEDSENEEEKEDSEDDLAPPKPEPRTRKQERGLLSPAGTVSSLPQQAPQSPPPYTPAAPVPNPNAQPPAFDASIPAVNWVQQMMPLPPTPAGQLAQNTIMAQITQAIQQAIHPFMVNMLASSPGVQPQPAIPVPPASSHNANTGDLYTSTTATTLRAAPLPEMSSDQPDASLSSTVVTRLQSPKQRRIARCVYIQSKRSKRPSDQDISHLDTSPMVHLSTNELNAPSSNPMSTNPRSAKRRRIVPDDETIQDINDIPPEMQKRTIGKRKPPTTKEEYRGHSPSSRIPSPNEVGHLPTPSSTFQDRMAEFDEREAKLAEEKAKLDKESIRLDKEIAKLNKGGAKLDEKIEIQEEQADQDAMIGAGEYFDDDERDLLSLTGDSDDGLPTNDHMEHDDLPSNEIVLPSVELDELMQDEDLLQDEHIIQDEDEDKDILHDMIAKATPSKETTDHEGRISTTPQQAIPSSAPKPTIKHQSMDIEPYSASDNDLTPIGLSSPSNPKPAPTHTCPTCNKPFKLAQNLSKHIQKFHPTSTAITTTEEPDELLAPFTPIKRESLTPPLSHLFVAPPKTLAFQTPASAPQLRDVGVASSSGAQDSAKDPPKKLARSAFLNKVKKSWAKKGSETERRRMTWKTWKVTPRKRGGMGEGDGDGDGDSGDELAG